VKAAGRLDDSHVSAFRNGLILPDGLECLPAELEILSVNKEQPYGAGADEDSASLSPAFVTEAKVTIREGKFHQVKRMFSAVGSEVIYLKRLSMGPVPLDPELAPGEYRRLTPEELSALSI